MEINYLNLKWSITRHVKKLSVLVVMCFIGSNLNAQKSVRIGYIDTEYVLENIDESIPLFAVYAEDGQQIALVEDQQVAFELAQEHKFSLHSVH